MNMNDEVEALYRQGSVWYPCSIIKVYGNGCYDLLYDDNVIEVEVKKEYIKPMDKEMKSRRDRMRRRRISQLKKEIDCKTALLLREDRDTLLSIYEEYICPQDKLLTKSQLILLLQTYSNYTSDDIDIMDKYFPLDSSQGRIDFDIFQSLYGLCKDCDNKLVRYPTAIYEGKELISCEHIKWTWCYDNEQYIVKEDDPYPLPSWAVIDYTCNNCQVVKLSDNKDLFFDIDNCEWMETCEICRLKPTPEEPEPVEEFVIDEPEPVEEFVIDEPEPVEDIVMEVEEDIYDLNLPLEFDKENTMPPPAKKQRMTKNMKANPIMKDILMCLYENKDKSIPKELHIKANHDDTLQFVGVVHVNKNGMDFFEVYVNENHVGTFLNKIQAAITYDIEARNIGLFTNLNFPQDSDKNAARRSSSTKSIVLLAQEIDICGGDTFRGVLQENMDDHHSWLLCLTSSTFRKRREEVSKVIDMVYGSSESFEVEKAIQGVSKKTLFNRTTPLPVLDRVLYLLNIKPGQKVIDIGSGNGAALCHITAMTGCSGIGIELVTERFEESVQNSKEFINQCSTFNICSYTDDQLKFLHGDVLKVMSEDIMKEADYFFWNNFRGLYTQTMVIYEGESMDLQDAIYNLIDKYRKPGNVVFTMYPLRHKRASKHVVIDRMSSDHNETLTKANLYFYVKQGGIESDKILESIRKRQNQRTTV